MAPTQPQPAQSPSRPSTPGAAPDGVLPALVAAQKRGEARGIPSVCSANPYVLRAAMRLAAEMDQVLLVESTCNQVNQEGGYMGLIPAGFRAYLEGLAQECAFPVNRVLLGGDHLGPNPWSALPAEQALERADELVAASVQAGYQKLHLDASMALGGDPPGGPPPEVAAERSGRLAQAAERARQAQPTDAPPPWYVVGTEVPPPGGARGSEDTLSVTPVERAAHTLALTRAAFTARGLEQAWPRVMALVVQPGVEFGDDQVHGYQRDRAAGLSRWIEGVPGIVFEAHSTDYQTPTALRQLVEDHYAVLKVGPGLTFALREALFALEWIEQALLGAEHRSLSRLQETLEAEMLRSPRYWQPYYHGSANEQAFKRRYSLSDRIRYYWSQPGPSAAVERLLENLGARELPLSLVSQFFPELLPVVRAGQLAPAAQALLDARVGSVLRAYWQACGAG